MKKLLLFIGAIALSSGLSIAQCPFSGVQFGAGAAPSPGNNITITTCAYAGEYSSATGVVSGNSYTVTGTGGTNNYMTIFDATNTAIAWGLSPVSFVAASSGTFSLQVNLIGCGTESQCHTINIANTTPPPPCPTLTTPWFDNIEAFAAATNIGSVNCWQGSAASSFNWNVTAGGTPSSGTGALAANSGTKFFYTEASGASVGAIAYLVTPEMDLTGLTLPMVTFYYHMFGSQIGTLNVQITTDNGATWTTVNSIVGAQQVSQASPWLLSETTLAGYSGLVKFRFEAVSAGSFEGDISLDDFSVIEAPTCPTPTNLVLNSSDLTSATFSWNPGNTETEWTMEYGSPGFTPGTGTSSLVINNSNETVLGFTSNTFYEMYVRAVCSPGDTSGYIGPLAFNTYDQGMYMDFDNDCGPGFLDISGTGTGTGLGDDGTVGVTLPFTLLYQGTPVNLITISNNGAIAFGSLTAGIPLGGVVDPGTANGIYPFWDDIDSESGDVYYETIGTSPNQTFIVQWEQRPHFSGVIGQDVTFQIQIDQASGEIYFVYTDVEFGGSQTYADFAANGGIGAAGPNQDLAVSSYDPNYLMNNSCAHFFYTDCPNPTNFAVTYVDNDEVGLTWSAGLAGEVDWTIIYGPAGFDPLVSGTTLTFTTNGAIIPGLTAITDYDVYIYADCNPLILQSIGGLFGSFTTLPNCSDVTGIIAATATDSLFTNWSWSATPGYPITGFDLQYGSLGFALGSGTIVNADNNFSDTTADVTLMSGGVYEVYIQSLCGTDSSNYVGPISFTMPLDNDAACSPQVLPVDGATYAFDNAGATIQAGETTVTPPATGFNEVDGWGDANLNFSTWFSFTAPPSGNVWISGKDVGFDGQVAIYTTTNCANFNTYTLVAANDDAVDFTSAAPYLSVCGLTPGNTYYLMHDSWSTVTTGVYSLSLTEIIVEAGTSSGLIDICSGDMVDLFNGISGNDAGGSWVESIPTAGFSDPIFNSAGLAYQVFDFQYVVTDGCAIDVVDQQIEVYGPSSAGGDGALTVCQNEPFNLLTALNGTVDLGGTWYDPSSTALPSSSVTSGTTAGAFTYSYVASNGVCPPDTANIIVTVGACDLLTVNQLQFATMSVFPNPTSGLVYITNFGSTEVFNYAVTDLNGKLIRSKDSAVDGIATTEIDFKGLETGMYIIKVYNENSEKVFRIVFN